MSEGSQGNRNILLIAAVMLAVGIVAGGYLLGDGLRRARMADRAVTMRGLAERNVTADLATWTINFNAQGTDSGEVQAEIERDTAHRHANSSAPAGFPADAVTDARRLGQQLYDNNRQANVVTINRRLQFRTNDVMRAQRSLCAPVRSDPRPACQLQEGSNMSYSFTRLNALKPEMIAQVDPGRAPRRRAVRQR